MKRRTLIFITLFIGVLLLASCAHVQPIQDCVAGTKVYGFWNGLWHGMIAGITFIGSLFNHDIAVYAVNNNGGWYNFGFLLGVGGALGGGVTVRNRRR